MARAAADRAARARGPSPAGLGGGLGLLIAFFVGIVSPFIVSSEVSGLYERRDSGRAQG